MDEEETRGLEGSGLKVGILSLSGEKSVEGLLRKFQLLENVPAAEAEIAVHVEPVFIKLSTLDLDNKQYVPKERVDVVILVHSVLEGRFSLTNVMDARYDNLLPSLEKEYGPYRVAVVAHSLPNFSESTRDVRMMMLQSGQPTTFRCSNCVILSGRLEEMPAGDWDRLLLFIRQCSNHPMPAGVSSVSSSTGIDEMAPSTQASVSETETHPLCEVQDQASTPPTRSQQPSGQMPDSGWEIAGVSGMKPVEPRGGGDMFDQNGAGSQHYHSASHHDEGGPGEKEDTAIDQSPIATQHALRYPPNKPVLIALVTVPHSQRTGMMKAALQRDLESITVVDGPFGYFEKSWRMYTAALFDVEDHDPRNEKLVKKVANEKGLQNYAAILSPHHSVFLGHGTSHISGTLVFTYHIAREPPMIYFDQDTIRNIKGWIWNCSSRFSDHSRKRSTLCNYL